MRILIIIDTSFVPYGGLSTVVMNYYRAIDKKDLIIDIASTNNAPQSLVEELKMNNSHYYCLGKRKRVFSYSKKLFTTLSRGYDVVHVNGNSGTMALELLPAIRRKIPVRIAHVHTTKTEHPVLNMLIYPLFKHSFSKAIAVSENAGKWLFKNNYIILNNAIDISRYIYSDEKRKRIRNQYEIADSTFIIGNVGKLTPGKNQQFLLDVFRIVKDRYKDSKLFIVGGGDLEDDLKCKAKELGIDQDVIFSGMMNDASECYQAFDIFAFPSKFEGLGLALIEAQASGLKCIISDRIPTEAIVTPDVKILGIDRQEKEWADYILNNIYYDRKERSDCAKETIRLHGYDILIEAKKLRNIYFGEMEKK